MDDEERDRGVDQVWIGPTITRNDGRGTKTIKLLSLYCLYVSLFCETDECVCTSSPFCRAELVLLAFQFNLCPRILKEERKKREKDIKDQRISFLPPP